MPPKVTTTKEMILGAAFEIMKEEGLRQISSRKIAKKLNCSISPIFTSFKNMSELESEVMKMAWEQLLECAQKDYTDNIFLNQGIGIVLFARDNKLLYREMFLDAEKFSDLYVYVDLNFLDRSKKDPVFSSFPEEAIKDLRTKMWIFSRGLAAIVNMDQIEDDSIEFITKTLYEAGLASIIFLQTTSGNVDERIPKINDRYKGKRKVKK